MRLFICCAPFHIFTATNIAYNNFKDSTKDIYITDHIEDNYRCYLELRDKGIFDNVYYIKVKNTTQVSIISKYRIIRYTKIILKYFDSKNIIPQLNNKKYEEVLISSPDIVSEIVYYYYKKKNSNMKLYMYEEGTFAYNYFEYKINIFKKIFTKILYGRNIMEDHDGAYLYKPELSKTYENYNIKKIDIISNKDFKSATVLNNIMGYKEEFKDKLNYKYIFMDQAFGVSDILNEGIDIFEKIISQVGKENSVVKLHPRTEANIYREICKAVSIKAPYEIIAFNSDVNDKVLISIFSSACLNPKIIFNQEPYVILLFKIIDISIFSHINETSFDIAYKVKKNYKNPNKFFIPETVEELQEILKKIIK